MKTKSLIQLAVFLFFIIDSRNVYAEGHRHKVQCPFSDGEAEMSTYYSDGHKEGLDPYREGSDFELYDLNIERKWSKKQEYLNRKYSINKGDPRYYRIVVRFVMDCSIHAFHDPKNSNNVNNDIELPIPRTARWCKILHQNSPKFQAYCD